MQSSYWSLVAVSLAATITLNTGCLDTAEGAAVATDADASTTSKATRESAERAGADLVEDAGLTRRTVAADGDEDDAGAAPALPQKTERPTAATTSASPESCAPFVMPADCTTPPGRVLPTDLRCTGLYGNWEKRSPACGVTAYRPAYELWSDGAQKQRWVALPEGAKIDASRPEAFSYPVGTQFWKEFRISVKGELRPAETRLLRKSDKGWLYTSYVWDEKGERAVQTNDGAKDLFGSDHVVPTLEQCRQCHAGREDFVLGWDPIMLGTGATGAQYEKLIESGVLEHASGPAPKIPGVEHDVAALGYLHANCGISCHNPRGDAKDTGLFMRLDTDKLGDLYATPTLATGLYKQPWENAKIQSLVPPADMPFADIYFTRPDASLVLVRMQTRGSEAQMPPIGTRRVDEAGVAIVRKLIE
jgi:hypothetical protein